ncbi:tRNA dihydrouridine(20/20a) synthase DusA [Taylorella equigenitalis]|uniref:tRNA dihydrouridine(20/20a) synthase DusA n=1 Tax=Taylorella equigenitalis TaxID=29575 RepID=UPI000410E49C|nr:tRNA dihydrouridine(20/20a) synthase DusA [Taylorella equigenitalis]WDU47268.1 tRNA dihydrouridine(20/20a) synthase DusA [Taylorella equigenitalis]
MIDQKLNRGRRVSVAPMLDVTDKHCRFFHRLLSPEALLFTEMVTTGALIFGDVPRHLDFNVEEHPVALQLGGAEPKDLAYCSKLGEEWGYDEINLNCGCPSDRVQKGSFGACLMLEPDLVADCWVAMNECTTVPISIKHRLGVDDHNDYEFVYHFVSKLYDVGCRLFITHARNAFLKGLSPKDNRSIPPLKYDYVSRLKADFPDANFVINGGISNYELAMQLLEEFDGIMLGRLAWHEPRAFMNIATTEFERSEPPNFTFIRDALIGYAKKNIENGGSLREVVNPVLGFMNGLKGARKYRQILSNPDLLKRNDISIIGEAFAPFL